MSARSGENLAPELRLPSGAPAARTPGGLGKVDGPANPSESRIQSVQEVDVWWGSFAGRTMLPSFLLCGMLTVAIVWAATYFWLEGVAADPLRYAVYVIVGGLWLWQLFRWAYRLLGFNYRLTTHRLFYQRGFLYPNTPGVDLASIQHATVAQSWVGKLLGIGTVRIVVTGESRASVELLGIRHPQRIAAEIQGRARKARAQLRGDSKPILESGQSTVPGEPASR